MKQIILTLTFLLLTILPAGAVKKIEANPINLAVVLAEKADKSKIASYIDYYGYTLQAPDNEYQVMKHPNGDEIRYSFNIDDKESQYPTVIVKVRETPKAIDARLKELNFIKVGNNYERGFFRYNNYVTQCSFGPHNTLVISRIQK